MKKKRLSKQRLWEKQRVEDKKFNRILVISFSLLIIMTVSVLTFYTYGCDTRFLCIRSTNRVLDLGFDLCQ